LEAVLFPNASFVRSYEPMVAVTRDGEHHSGVLKRDSAEEVVLATGPNLTTRLKRSEITAMRPGTVSVMPQGLDQQLSKAELADLLAFLKATRW
jgi:putative heme-binding domain-containing protein